MIGAVQGEVAQRGELRLDPVRMTGVGWCIGKLDVVGRSPAPHPPVSPGRQVGRVVVQHDRDPYRRGYRLRTYRRSTRNSPWTSPRWPDTVAMRPGLTVADGRAGAAVPTPAAAGSRWWNAADGGCTRRSSGRSRPALERGCGSGSGRPARP